MIKTEEFKKSLHGLLAEAFGVLESPHGFFLDTGQSGLLGTINRIDAATASATFDCRRGSFSLFPCEQSISTAAGNDCACSKSLHARTLCSSKLGPRAPPRRITWQSWLPSVSKIAQ